MQCHSQFGIGFQRVDDRVAQRRQTGTVIDISFTQRTLPKNVTRTRVRHIGMSQDRHEIGCKNFSILRIKNFGHRNNIHNQILSENSEGRLFLFHARSNSRSRIRVLLTYRYFTHHINLPEEKILSRCQIVNFSFTSSLHHVAERNFGHSRRCLFFKQDSQGWIAGHLLTSSRNP